MYVVQQARLAAKQVSRPSDVHDQAIRTIQPDPRAIALRPARQGVQKLLIPHGVCRMALQITAKRPGI
jgi:hypothetical protein